MTDFQLPRYEDMGLFWNSDDIKRKVADRLEMLVAAYWKSTNIPPEECELVVRYGENEIMFTYRKKENKDDK